MPKLLITGASGFIGSFLVEEGLRRNFDVYAGIRSSSSKKYLQDEKIQFFNIDFENQQKLIEDISAVSFDFIVHAAGTTAAKNQATYDKVNAGYTRTLLEAIRSSGKTPTKFIFLSSLASYGPADNLAEGIVSETAPPAPITQYGKSKLKAEEIFAEYPDIPSCILRPTAVFGPRDKDILQVFQMINKGFELYIGKKKQNLTFIFVKDLVEIIFRSLTPKQLKPAYFVSDGNYYSAEEFNALIKSKLGNRTLSLRLPIPIVKIIALIMEGVSKLTGKYPALNRDKLNELKSINWVCDVQALFEDLSFTPSYTLDQAVEETVRWYKEHNWI